MKKEMLLLTVVFTFSGAMQHVPEIKVTLSETQQEFMDRTLTLTMGCVTQLKDEMGQWSGGEFEIEKCPSTFSNSDIAKVLTAHNFNLKKIIQLQEYTIKTPPNYSLFCASSDFSKIIMLHRLYGEDGLNLEEEAIYLYDFNQEEGKKRLTILEKKIDSWPVYVACAVSNSGKNIAAVLRTNPHNFVGKSLLLFNRQTNKQSTVPLSFDDIISCAFNHQEDKVIVRARDTYKIVSVNQ